MNQIIKEIAETVENVKESLGIKNNKQALDIAIKLQTNRMTRDLIDTLKTKIK